MDTDDVASGRRRFAERWLQQRGRLPGVDRRVTLSGSPVEPVYAPDDLSADSADSAGGAPGFERIGWPGEYPFTRGIHTTGYLGKPWTVRQFAGFGSAADTNARFRQLLARGSDGISVAFDMPTLMGLDSDDPRAAGEVGHCGVAIDSAQDMERLMTEIPLDAVTTSMTISGPAVPLFCTYVVAAERAGVDAAALVGTLQTDIFKEYIAQKEWIFPPEPHLRLIGDLLDWTQQHAPRYHPISISGYHIREAGATAAQELAFTLADGFGYVELGVARGLAVDDFAPRLSFFFDAHIDFFEEIAKFRAARRIWARWMRDRYRATTDQAQWLRFHTQTAGVSLTAQQPENNVVRTAIEALAAVLGGTNSLHTNALDEVLALPTEATAEVALRTQHVLLEETGVASVIDPLGGSWFVEASTDRMEEEVESLLAEIEALGDDGSMTSGIVAGIESGWFTRHISDSADAYQRSVESGDRRVVGVNAYTDSVAPPLEVLRISGEVETDQVSLLRGRKVTRDHHLVQQRLDDLAVTARGKANLVPPMLDAVRAEATVGELCAALREVFGGYTEPPDF
jgi:methylmalonyl-CoA mutase N-terminal domain/subunit